MNGIITVLGKDQVGIAANVCVYLAGRGISILDISQTIVHGYFSMLMIVSMAGQSFDDTARGLEALGETIGVKIQLQHEAIFNAMHRI